MFSLASKTALITGASGGIGSAIAKTFIELGATVVLSGTKNETLQALKESLLSTYNEAKIFILPTNLKDATSVDILFDEAEKQAGPIDILVNNAGITKDNLLMRMKDDEWQDVIDVNLTSCFRICKSAIKSMMKRRYGRIINISSVVATMGNAGQTNYCAAKAGMIGFSKALAKEVATRGITVNCVAPGFIETNMTHRLNDAIKAQILSQIPVNKMGSADEIAAPVAFLASEKASYITGQTLHINGGMEMI